MPQPLSRVAPNAGIHVGNSTDNPSHHRPELALAAMRVISEWSILESFITGLFVSTLKEGAMASAAIFATIRNQAAQRDAIAAAINATIEQKELKQVAQAVFTIYTNASKTRNKLAHWVWGVAPELPDSVLLADPIALAAYRAAIQEFTNGNMDGTPPELDKSRIFVYTLEDFQEASNQIQRAIQLTARATVLLSSSQHQPLSDQLFHQLSNEPEIRAELERLNKGRQNAQ